jgi:hypothetical protein
MNRRLPLVVALLLALPATLSAQVELKPGESVTVHALDSVRVEIDSIPYPVHDTTIVHDTTVVVDSIPYFECPDGWTCTPPPDTVPTDTIPEPPPDTAYTQPPTIASHRPEFSRGVGGIRVTWGSAERAREYRITRRGAATMLHPDTTIILPLVDGDWLCILPRNEAGDAPEASCNRFWEADLPPIEPLPDTTAFYWPAEPVAPDSISVHPLDGNLYVRVDWFEPTYGGEGTGWIIHSELVGGGDSFAYVGQMRLRSAELKMAERGDHEVCVTAVFDPTQEPYDAYTVGVTYPDRILPDTTVAARATPTCETFFWHGYSIHAESQIGDEDGFVAGHTSRFTLLQSGEEAWSPAPDSVVFTVDGNRAVERLTPYRFPGDDVTYTVPNESTVDLEWQVYGDQPAKGSQRYEVTQ